MTWSFMSMNYLSKKVANNVEKLAYSLLPKEKLFLFVSSMLQRDYHCPFIMTSKLNSFSDDNLILKEYKLHYHELKTEKMRMLVIRQNLMHLNKKYEDTSKSLLSIKNDYEHYRSHLCNTLFNQKMALDKQKILSQKKVNEFLENRKRNEEYLRVSPLKFILEELVKKNTILQEECQKMTDLLQLTKQQYNELFSKLTDTFNQKVCEFSRAFLEQSAELTSQWK